MQKLAYAYSSGAWVQQKEILFVYDGWNLVKETTIAADQSAVDKYYVWGLDLSQSIQGAGGVGGLLATIDGSLTYQYLYDANGNVGQVVDAADGSIAARYEYDPYNNSVHQSGAYAGVNAYRFSTKYLDEETNLYYYGYRYYAPEVGRWINRDPSGEVEEYLLVFLNNDPTNKVDYLGLINVNQLPGIMIANGFNEGAALLSRWLNSPAGKQSPDTTTIKMSWVLGFDRARTVYDEILRDKIYANKYAKEEILEYLHEVGVTSGSSFGNFTQPIQDIDKHYINQRRVGNLLRDPLDGLFAALARFNLRVLIKGKAFSVTETGACIAIESIGVYGRDSFDFEGNEPLGYWDPTNNNIRKWPFPAGYPVTNWTLRDHRKRTGRGGDFLVFSEVVETKLTPPEFVSVGSGNFGGF